MEPEFVHTRLPGCLGPFFPPSLLELHKLLYGPNGPSLNKFIIEDRLRHISDFASVDWKTTTDDGYAWFLSAEFFAFNTRITCLFPWETSDDHRHTALYTTRKTSAENLEKFSRQLVLTWETAYI